LWVGELGGARRARLLPTEGRSAGLSTFASFSARRRRRACRLSHHFDSFCGGHLLFAYACSTGVFGVIHRCFKHHCMHMMMMIAFITFKSSLVPLFEGL